MKKRILAAVIAAATVLSLTGCGDKNTSSAGDTSTPAASGGTDASTPGGDTSAADPAGLVDDDDTLSILAWTGNEDMDNFIEFFSKKTGFPKEKINWVQQGTSGGEAKEKYMDYLKGDGDADILVCDAGWAQKYMNSEYCMPMSELGITKAQYPDAYPYTLQIGTNKNGEFAAPTFQATPGLWVYNAKLAKQYLNVENADQMQEKVKDWASFEATAEELKTASGGKVKLTVSLGGIWEVKKSDRTGAWVKDGKFTMTSEGEEIIDLYKKYADNGWVDASIATWTPAWFNAVNSGDAMGAFIPTWGLKGQPGSMLHNFAAGIDDSWAALGEAANDTFVAVSGPQDWYWGGSYFVVTNRCNTKKSAAEFLKLFTQDADAMKEYGNTYGDFMNNKKIMPEVTFKNPVLIDGQDQFKILLNKADKINLGDAVTEYDSDIGDKIADAAAKYAKGEISSKEDAIKEAKKAIVEVYPDITIE